MTVAEILSETFKDKHGHIVLVQWPNVPLFGWILLELAASFTHEKHLSPGLHNTATAFLAIWAYLEIRLGVNYFRRAFGIVVAISIVMGYFVN